MKRDFTPVDKSEKVICSNRCKVNNDKCKATLVLTDKRLYIDYDDDEKSRRSILLPTIDLIAIDRNDDLNIRSFQDSIIYDIDIVNSNDWKDKINNAVTQKINANIQGIIDSNPIIHSNVVHVVNGEAEDRAKLIIVKNHHMYIKYDDPNKRTEVILFDYKITKKDTKTLIIDKNGQPLEVKISNPDKWLEYKNNSERLWERSINSNSMYDSISNFFHHLGFIGSLFLILIAAFIILCVYIFLDTLGLIAVVMGGMFTIILLMQARSSHEAIEININIKKDRRANKKKQTRE